MWAGCRQIEKDLLRTMPSNACFAHVSGVGVPRLRRVLRALAWLYPEIGYCQGTGMVSTAWGDPPHHWGGRRGGESGGGVGRRERAARCLRRAHGLWHDAHRGHLTLMGPPDSVWRPG